MVLRDKIVEKSFLFLGINPKENIMEAKLERPKKNKNKMKCNDVTKWKKDLQKKLTTFHTWV